MLLLHPDRLCWAPCNWTLPLPPCAACSAVDLIRLGGGRLRFLVAKSDLDVSEKISASSCWLPLYYDIEKMKETGLRSDAHEMLESGVKSSCSTKTNNQRWEKMGLTPPQPLPPCPLPRLLLAADIRGGGRKRSRLIHQRLRWEI